MNNKYLSNILRFIGVTAIQLLVLNNVYLVGFVVPVIYIYFIMKLPFGTKRLVVLFLAFIVGLTIDVFVGTYGIHAAAATLIGACRHLFLKLSFGENEEDRENTPSIKEKGFYPFLGYTVALLGIHSATLFLLENLGYQYRLMLLFRIFASVAVSLFLIILLEYLMQTPQKKHSNY
jgi:energy-coupling factor transporter transmembrane protein EcfT